VLQLGKLQNIDFQENGKVEVQAGVQLNKLIKACSRKGLSGLESLNGIPGTVGGALMTNAGALGAEIGDLVKQINLTDGMGDWIIRRDQADFSYRNSGLEGKGVITGALLQLSKHDAREVTERSRKALEWRKEVQKVSGPHAGSVFKNPDGEKAWQLIEQVGLRGRRIGNAQIAVEHCNHIVNLGGASSADVLALIEEVLQAVLQETGKQLELEVRLVGW
jgi:UDP-N-acetylmuramate dehydrogenase